MRSREEIEEMIKKIHLGEDVDWEEPEYVIFNTLRWVLGEVNNDAITDYLPIEEV